MPKKRKITFLLFHFLIIFFLSYAYSQDLRTILENYIQKNGGNELYEGFKNVIIDQYMYSNGVEIKQQSIIIDKKMFYQKSNYPKGDYTICVFNNGYKSWEINERVSSAPYPIDSSKESPYKSQMNVLGPIYDFLENPKKTKVKNISILSSAVVDYQECYVLEVIYNTGFVEKLFISKDRYILLKIKNTMGEVSFSDYRKSEYGLSFPYSTEVRSNMGSFIIEVKSVQVNKEIDEKDFNKL